MKEKQPKKTKLRIKIILLSIFICMASLLLCGGTIFFTYFRSMSPQIQGDISFLIEETLDNFSSRITLAENVLLRIRSNKILMQHLKDQNKSQPSPYDEDLIQSQFENCVDIYASTNTEGMETPFLENVFLFPASERVTTPVAQSFYSSHTKSEKEALRRDFSKVYEDFLSSGSDICFYPSGDSLRLAAGIYDDSFHIAGVLIYDISHTSFKDMMSNMDRYKDSFWVVFDRNDQILEKSNGFSIPEEALSALAQTNSGQVSVCRFSSRPYLASARYLGLGFRVAAGIPKNYINSMLYDSIKVYLYLLLILAPAVFALAFFITYRMTKPLKIVEEKMKLVEQGAFDTRLPDFDTAEFSDISHVFNSMTGRIDYLINEVYEKQIIIKESQLQFLQAQMNPHFMFNVLNTIALQAKFDGNEQVYQMIHSFSLLIQAKICKTGKEKIPVQEELEYVNFYLYLQKCRFEDKLTYEIHLEPPSCAALLIPRLCIQPIAENSMVHGIEPSQHPGHIQIQVTQKEDTLVISVKDNGVGFPKELHGETPEEIHSYTSEDHTHIGMLNVHKIIRHFYGEPYGVSIFSIPQEGTQVILTLPLEYGQEEKEDNHV